jgi:M6 family metalloprotease-like protein
MKHKISLIAVLLTLSCAATGIDAQNRYAGRFAEIEPRAGFARPPLQGRIELFWSDPMPGSADKAEFRVTLIEDSGRRRTLSADDALRAAGDLYALNGRRVALTLAEGAASIAKAANTGELVPEAIVPIDDLVPNGSQAKALPADIAVGTRPWATLLCKFNDLPAEPEPKSYFETKYLNQSGGLDHYFRQVSNNKLNIAGSKVFGWFTLPKKLTAYYTLNANGGKEPKWDLLLDDCLAVANPSVNLSGFSGIVVQTNGEYGAAGGIFRDRTIDGVTKSWMIAWLPGQAIYESSRMAHEMGHAFGLPHANNSDNDSDTYDNPWDTMSTSYVDSYVDPVYGRLPKHYGMYSKNRLGWVSDAQKRIVTHNTATTITMNLDRANYPGTAANRQMVVLQVPGDSTHYYVIEARLRKVIYDKVLAGDAVIIHEVRTNRREPAWSMDADNPKANTSNNEGSMFKVGETWTSAQPLGKRYQVKVNSATAEGFNITIKSL